MNGEIEISAPTAWDAERLCDRLAGSTAQVVQVAPRSWVVRVRPWQSGGRAVAALLSEVEAWLAESRLPATTVRLDGREYHLSARTHDAAPNPRVDGLPTAANGQAP